MERKIIDITERYCTWLNMMKEHKIVPFIAKWYGGLCNVYEYKGFIYREYFWESTNTLHCLTCEKVGK